MSDWFEWEGKLEEFPIPLSVDVEVELRNGDKYTGKAEEHQWLHQDSPLDVMLYRIATPSKEESPPPSSTMDKEDWLSFQKHLFKHIHTLTAQKNNDYTAGSDDPFANFRLSAEVGVDPLQGLVVRMADKWQRVKSYHTGELLVPNEGLEDAFMDLIGYSSIALGMLCERGMLSLPQEKVND